MIRLWVCVGRWTLGGFKMLTKTGNCCIQNTRGAARSIGAVREMRRETTKTAILDNRFAYQGA